jgi:putative endonuclease
VIARNWYCKRGELDVVAFSRGVLVVCEVKARATNNLGTPAEAVTVAKQLKVRRATSDYRAHLALEQPMLSRAIRSTRFDVACVLGTQLEMLHDAF